jgi:hypothetical protein
MARIFSIVLAIFFINASLTFVALNNTAWVPQSYNWNITSTAQNMLNSWNPNWYSGLGVVLFIGDVVRSVTYILQLMLGCVYILPYLTSIFYMPVELAAIIQGGLWIIMVYGFVEFLRGIRV